MKSFGLPLVFRSVYRTIHTLSLRLTVWSGRRPWVAVYHGSVEVKKKVGGGKERGHKTTL